MKLQLTAVLIKEEVGGYSSICPELEVASQGETLEEAVENLKEAVEQLERQFIKRALQRTKGNQARAAEMLGIHRNTLFMKLNQFGIRGEI